jgi:hypothetical protein
MLVGIKGNLFLNTHLKIINEKEERMPWSSIKKQKFRLLVLGSTGRLPRPQKDMGKRFLFRFGATSGHSDETGQLLKILERTFLLKPKKEIT